MVLKCLNKYRLDFICAGSSAIMLTFAHVHPGWWFIAFFALIPFLSRLGRVGCKEAFMLGMMLATTYMFASGLKEISLAPQWFVFKLVALNAVFAILGFSIRKLRTFLKSDPLLSGLIWIPLWLVFIQYYDLHSIFRATHIGPNLVINLYSLSSILIWSCVVILGNSLILAFARYVIRQFSQYKRALSNRRFCSPLKEILLKGSWYCFPNVRAPPLHACNQNK